MRQQLPTAEAVWRSVEDQPRKPENSTTRTRGLTDLVVPLLGQRRAPRPVAYLGRVAPRPTTSVMAGDSNVSAAPLGPDCDALRPPPPDRWLDPTIRQLLDQQAEIQAKLAALLPHKYGPNTKVELDMLRHKLRVLRAYADDHSELGPFVIYLRFPSCSKVVCRCVLL